MKEKKLGLRFYHHILYFLCEGWKLIFLFATSLSCYWKNIHVLILSMESYFCVDSYIWVQSS